MNRVTIIQTIGDSTTNRVILCNSKEHMIQIAQAQEELLMLKKQRNAIKHFKIIAETY